MKYYIVPLIIAGSMMLFSCADTKEEKVNSNNETVVNNNPQNPDLLPDENQKRYVIKGKLDNPSEVVGPVYLNQLIQQNLIRKDTAILDAEGNFEFEGRVEVPDFYQIVFSNGKYLVLILDNLDLEFYADMNDFDATKKLSGSRDQEVFVQITESVNRRNSKRNELTVKMQEAQVNQDEAQMNSITEEYMLAENASIQELKNILREGADSYVAAIGAINFLDENKEFQFMDSLSSVLIERFPESRYVNELAGKVNALRSVSIGAEAPEITLPDPNGVPNSLSAYRGKYVLIDFWASWCRPCRAENPNVVKMYQELEGKNFEIFGVSLDKDRDKWKEAIKTDKITWPQVSDLQGWQSSAAASYQVSGIPATFLIDPQGKIIAKNLRGEELREKMKEILG